jgi:hypothetical protein
MSTFYKAFTVFIISILISSCAVAPIKIPEKYNLDNQLENVPKITNFHLNSWESVDNQSVILETGINSYYLIILNTPDYKLPFREIIAIDNDNAMIRPGYENVNGYVIYKIYRFKDYEQARSIKAQLSGERK